jgi:hypothetical protein
VCSGEGVVDSDWSWKLIGCFIGVKESGGLCCGGEGSGRISVEELTCVEDISGSSRFPPKLSKVPQKEWIFRHLNQRSFEMFPNLINICRLVGLLIRK